MGKFDSPLGTKNFSGGALREFDVPDESVSMPQRHRNIPPDLDAIREFQSRLDSNVDIDLDSQEEALTEQEFRQARAAKKTGKARLNDGARRRIEMLLGMSKHERSFELDGNSYTLEALKAKDMREVFMETAKYDGTVESPYEMRRQLVARSLSKVAEYDLEQFLGSNSIETRLAFVDELPEALLGRVFAEYQLLVKESTDKYSIKDDVDAKEVLEDLKK